MNDDHGHVALPKLYGAPAYARPPLLPVSQAERPFDPDALPLECERDGQEQEPLGAQPANDHEPVTARSGATDDAPVRFLGRPLRLRLPGRDQAGR